MLQTSVQVNTLWPTIFQHFNALKHIFQHHGHIMEYIVKIGSTVLQRVQKVLLTMC